jgi:hypothetical protein
MSVVDGDKWFLRRPSVSTLQLLCTYGTPVRKYLGCWPAFPLVIDYSFRIPDFEDNVIAALEHPSRVRRIKLAVTNLLGRKLVTCMQEPFPALTHLSILSLERTVPILRSGFLGGSAPCLRKIHFQGMPTFALPILLSSASNLVNLVLLDCDIPLDGYAALVTGLAMLPRLKTLSIAFVPCTDHWQIHPLPETRAVLPALTSLTFDGKFKFLEDFVAQIDAPLLNFIDITLLHSLDAQIPQLSEFISRSDLKLSRFRDARIYFDDGDTIYISLGPGVEPDAFPIAIHITSCEGTFEQVSCMAQMLSQTPAILSNVVRLEIKAVRPYYLEDDYEEADNIDWLELLCPFTAVETLNVSQEFSEMVAHALEEMLAETANQVLPALYSLLLEGEHMKSIEKLFTTLQDRGRPHLPLSILCYGGSLSEYDCMNDGDRQTHL